MDTGLGIGSTGGSAPSQYIAVCGCGAAPRYLAIFGFLFTIAHNNDEERRGSEAAREAEQRAGGRALVLAMSGGGWFLTSSAFTMFAREAGFVSTRRPAPRLSRCSPTLVSVAQHYRNSLLRRPQRRARRGGRAGGQPSKESQLPVCFKPRACSLDTSACLCDACPRFQRWSPLRGELPLASSAVGALLSLMGLDASGHLCFVSKLPEDFLKAVEQWWSSGKSGILRHASTRRAEGDVRQGLSHSMTTFWLTARPPEPLDPRPVIVKSASLTRLSVRRRRLSLEIRPCVLRGLVAMLQHLPHNFVAPQGGVFIDARQ